LDGVRAIACLLVVLHHITQRLGAHAESSLLEGIKEMLSISAPAGVSVFFVLSGTLLSYPFWRNYVNGEKLPGLKNYWLRRAARIMPAFYAALTASMLLETLFVPDIPSKLLRYMTALTFTSGFHYTTFFPTITNGPLWSISFEVFSYFLLPIFMIGLFKLGKARKFGFGISYWLAVLAFIFAANSLILTYLQPDDFERGWQYGGLGGAKYWMPNYNPVGFFAHYIMGIFAAGFIVLFEKNKLLREKLAAINLFDILSAVGLVCFAAILWTQRTAPDFSFSLQHQPYYYPALAFSMAMVVATAPYSKWIGRLLDNPFSRYTAKISFGLYVWHYFVLSFFHPQIPFGITNVGQWFTVGCAVIVISYIVASLSWYYLEKPILDAVRNRGKKNVLPQGIAEK
jgi:peptidoglycan/LPS O-acetylase OafA/YrhL